MNYILFNKNTPVLNFSFDEENFSFIFKINEIYHVEYAPYSTFKNETVNKTDLNKWWRNRSIPASRKNLEYLLDKIEVDNQYDLIVKSFGASLSDQYWIKPENANLAWDDINFFNNEFSDDIGELLFSNRLVSTKDFNFSSPDNTSEGQLIKRWKIIDNKRCLLKKGKEGLPLEVYNEIIASEVLDKLKFDHVKYSMLTIDDEIISCCENFITPDTELITAHEIFEINKKPNNLSAYEFLKKQVQKLGITDFDEKMSEILAFDFIVANRDRHFRNFGFIRDVNTLEFKGFAPIFDNGTSLWNDMFYKMKFETLNYKSKPFNEDPLTQIKWIKCPERINLTNLTNINNVVQSAFANNPKLIDWGKNVSERINSQINVLEYQLENIQSKPKAKLATRGKSSNHQGLHR